MKDTVVRVARKWLIQVVFVILIVLVLFTGYKAAVFQPLGRKTSSLMESITDSLRTRYRANTPNVIALKDPKVNATKVVERHDEIFQPTPISKLNTMNIVDLYKLYLKLVEVPTFMCATQKRYGNALDGGWEVCEQPPYTLTAPCLIHSWGINWDFSFDDSISQKLGCNVHSFDPSMKVQSFNRSDKISFHNYGLTGQQPSKHIGWNMKTFNETLRDLYQEKSQIDYIKIDIEGDEWDVLTPMLVNENSFKHIRQFALEVHLLPCISQPQIVKAVTVLERMRQLGLELYHSHRNPYGMGVNANLLLGELKSCCHEVYYVNTKYKAPLK